MKQPDKGDSNLARLWKIGSLYDQLNDIYTKFYNPSEHIAMDEVTVLQTVFQKSTNLFWKRQFFH
jgi:hypothetical protein